MHTQMHTHTIGSFKQFIHYSNAYLWTLIQVLLNQSTLGNHLVKHKKRREGGNEYLSQEMCWGLYMV